jgi:hypothetical protein
MHGITSLGMLSSRDLSSYVPKMNGGRPGLTGIGSLLGPAFLFTICLKNGIGLVDRRDVALAVFEGCLDQRPQ